MQYKIYIEPEVITVCAVEEVCVKAFYFADGGDAEGTAQELKDLLAVAGADVEIVTEG